eukprot:RCo047339
MPSWRQWEVAARGPDAWVYPWGNSLDTDAMEVEGMVHVWSAPNPNYGRANKDGMRETARETTATCSLNRAADFGPLSTAVSPFGLRGLLRWGKEWNVVAGEPRGFTRTPELAHTHCMRSLCDLLSIHDVHRWDTSFKEELLASNHRAFSAPMAFCLRAPPCFGDGEVAPRAAFRLAFVASGQPQIHAARPATPSWL